MSLTISKIEGDLPPFFLHLFISKNINPKIRNLDDHRILVKFQRDIDQNIFKELDHGTFVKFFKDFDQNSGGQP